MSQTKHCMLQSTRVVTAAALLLAILFVPFARAESKRLLAPKPGSFRGVTSNDLEFIELTLKEKEGTLRVCPFSYDVAKVSIYTFNWKTQNGLVVVSDIRRLSRNGDQIREITLEWLGVRCEVAILGIDWKRSAKVYEISRWKRAVELMTNDSK